MIVDIRPVVFGGENSGLPGWKDVVVECPCCANREGNAAHRNIVMFNFDLCLFLMLVSVCITDSDRIQTLFVFRDSEPLTGLARAASSSCESSSSCNSMGSSFTTASDCFGFDFAFGAGAADVRATATILFEFEVVRFMAVDDREVGAE